MTETLMLLSLLLGVLLGYIIGRNSTNKEKEKD